MKKNFQQTIKLVFVSTTTQNSDCKFWWNKNNNNNCIKNRRTRFKFLLLIWSDISISCETEWIQTIVFSCNENIDLKTEENLWKNKITILKNVKICIKNLSFELQIWMLFYLQRWIRWIFSLINLLNKLSFIYAWFIHGMWWNLIWLIRLK